MKADRALGPRAIELRRASPQSIFEQRWAKTKIRTGTNQSCSTSRDKLRFDPPWFDPFPGIRLSLVGEALDKIIIEMVGLESSKRAPYKSLDIHPLIGNHYDVSGDHIKSA